MTNDLFRKPLLCDSAVKREFAPSFSTHIWSSIMKKVCTLFAACLAMSGVVVEGTLIAYESFDITAGSNNLANSSGAGSSGFSNNWTTINDSNGGNVVSPGFEYAPIISAGNRAQIFNADANSDNQATYFYRTLSDSFTVEANSVGTFWASFMIQSTAASQGGLGATIGFFDVSAPAANTISGVTIGAVGGSANYRVAHRALDTSGSGTVLTTGTNAGDLVFMVAKITIDTNPGAAETISLWINPTTFDGTEASLGTATLDNVSLGNMGISSINSIAFGSNYVSTSNPTLGLDEIRMGHTLASVTPIPEPGTLALVGIALGSLLVFRRRFR